MAALRVSHWKYKRQFSNPYGDWYADPVAHDGVCSAQYNVGIETQLVDRAQYLVDKEQVLSHKEPRYVRCKRNVGVIRR